ncbi:MAG: hypothetical protein AAFV88_22695, partial [Planctomycetota bacterium]
RNTTNAPITPLGSATPLSPLAPVQGSASLSPIQPASGISTFGAPTRVPPPPTGSYTSPSSYGTSSNYLQPSQNTLGSVVPYGSGNLPAGALTDGGGRTTGVTQLVPTGNSGIRQTSWTPDPNFMPQGSGASIPFGGSAAPMRPPATTRGSGGMPAIDLTQTPYPPGYVPPQNRPTVGFPSTIPFPGAAQTPQFNPSATQPLGSPSLGAPSLGSPGGTSGWQSTPAPPAAVNANFPSDQGFGRSFAEVGPPSNALPTTSAVETASANNNQWRTPTPGF